MTASNKKQSHRGKIAKDGDSGNTRRMVSGDQKFSKSKKNSKGLSEKARAFLNRPSPLPQATDIIKRMNHAAKKDSANSAIVESTTAEVERLEGALDAKIEQIEESKEALSVQAELIDELHKELEKKTEILEEVTAAIAEKQNDYPVFNGPVPRSRSGDKKRESKPITVTWEEKDISGTINQYIWMFYLLLLSFCLLGFWLWLLEKCKVISWKAIVYVEYVQAIYQDDYTADRRAEPLAQTKIKYHHANLQLLTTSTWLCVNDIPLIDISWFDRFELRLNDIKRMTNIFLAAFSMTLNLHLVFYEMVFNAVYNYVRLLCSWCIVIYNILNSFLTYMAYIIFEYECEREEFVGLMWPEYIAIPWRCRPKYYGYSETRRMLLVSEEMLAHLTASNITKTKGDEITFGEKCARVIESFHPLNLDANENLHNNVELLGRCANIGRDTEYVARGMWINNRATTAYMPLK